MPHISEPLKAIQQSHVTLSCVDNKKETATNSAQTALQESYHKSYT